MAAFIASYRNEWHKLMQRKKYIVFFCLGIGFYLGWALLAYLAATFLRRYGVASLALVLSPTPMGVLTLFIQVLIPFLIFMGLTDLITVEGADSTMKAMLCRPVERWKLYAAKIAAVWTYAGVYLAGAFVVSVLSYQILGRGLSFGDFFVALASYVLTLVPLAVLACFAALVALFGRSGTLTMLLLLLSYMVLRVAPLFFPLLNEILFTSFLGWHRLWIGALPAASRLVHMLVIVFGYGTVFFMAGTLLFDRKEY